MVRWLKVRWNYFDRHERFLMVVMLISIVVLTIFVVGFAIVN